MREEDERAEEEEEEEEKRFLPCRSTISATHP